MSEPMLEKRPGLLAELAAADPRLKVLAYYAAAYCFARFAVVPMLTRVRGTRAETIERHGAGAGLSVHEADPCRGADFRTRGLLTDEEAQSWEDELDRRFQYSPARSSAGRITGHTCATFETQAKGLLAGRDPALPPVVPHLHVQVPPWLSGVPVIQLWDSLAVTVGRSELSP